MGMYTEQLPQRIRVRIIESERGRGSKIDETLYFDTKEEAQEYCKIYNAKNNLDYVPDWYMYAEIS